MAWMIENLHRIIDKFEFRISFEGFTYVGSKVGLLPPAAACHVCWLWSLTHVMMTSLPMSLSAFYLHMFRCESLKYTLFES